MTTASKSVALVKPEMYLRSSILGTQVINQANANRLGIVNQIWVDPEQMQVLVFEVSQQAFSSGALTVELSQITTLGRDALLVSSDEVFDELDLTGLAKITGSQVLTTETGLVLGKVKDFRFNSASGLISELVLSRLGIPFLPGVIDSTYRMQAHEVLSVGDRRIIVAEGAEARLITEQESIFERFSIATPPWKSRPMEGVRGALPRSFDEGEDELYEEEYEEELEDEAFDEIYAEDEPEPMPRRPRSPQQPTRPPVAPEPDPEPAVSAIPSPDPAAQIDQTEAQPDPEVLNPVPPPEATAWEDQPERSPSSGF